MTRPVALCLSKETHGGVRNKVSLYFCVTAVLEQTVLLHPLEHHLDNISQQEVEKTAINKVGHTKNTSVL